MILAHFGSFWAHFGSPERSPEPVNYCKLAPSGDLMREVTPTGDTMRKVAPTGDRSEKMALRAIF